MTSRCHRRCQLFLVLFSRRNNLVTPHGLTGVTSSEWHCRHWPVRTSVQQNPIAYAQSRTIAALPDRGRSERAQLQSPAHLVRIPVLQCNLWITGEILLIFICCFFTTKISIFFHFFLVVRIIDYEYWSLTNTCKLLCALQACTVYCENYKGINNGQWFNIIKAILDGFHK